MNGRPTSRSGWTPVVAGFWIAIALLARPARVAAATPDRAVPPPAEQRVTLANWLQPPHEQWAMTHLEQLTTVATVDHGELPATYLGPLWLDLQKFLVTGPDGRSRTFDQAFDEQNIDALLLWHGGSLRLERYRDGNSARDRHAMLTATSAFTGLLAEMLIAEKQFDDMRLVTFYLPELKGSAWDKASVREALDMEVGLDYREFYGDPWSDFGQLMAASRLLGPPGAMRVAPSITEYLHGVRRQGEPGMDYQPASPNVEVLGWIMHRVTGKSVAQLFEEKLFKPLGADRDAYFVTDAAGMSSASAGLGITARDLLRLGVLLAQRGQYNMQQIVPPEVVQALEEGGERRHAVPGNEQAPFYSYKSHWHIYHPAKTFAAWGIHGQYLFVAPEQQVVLVMQSSHPDAWGPHVGLAEAFFHALVEHVQR